ncbi:hypothetical protein MRX96_006424 [Rhipicephalus microplus]
MKPAATADENQHRKGTPVRPESPLPRWTRKARTCEDGESGFATRIQGKPYWETTQGRPPSEIAQSASLNGAWRMRNASGSEQCERERRESAAVVTGHARVLEIGQLAELPTFGVHVRRLKTKLGLAPLLGHYGAFRFHNGHNYTYYTRCGVLRSSSVVAGGCKTAGRGGGGKEEEM